MTIAVISPGRITGRVSAPAGKSAMQRACALGLLNIGTTVIKNPGKSDDDLAALSIIRSLGAEAEYLNDELIINSTGNILPEGVIHCGESGLSLRLFAAIAALGNTEVMLEGKGSLLRRPMHFFDETFPALGITVKSSNGFLPIMVKGSLVPNDITIDGSVSSQYLTGLLFAFAKAARKQVVITVSDLKSRPYVDLSIQMLRHFGYDIWHEGYNKFIIHPVDPVNRQVTYRVEGDWSSAAFLLVAGAISGELQIHGLDLDSVQADRSVLKVLQQCGADIHIEENSIRVTDHNELSGFEFDATDCPDLFPPLVALAACCNGISVIKGISRLTGKESNRADTLKDVFTKMGAGIRLEDDNMVINGGRAILAAKVSSHHDHRIAMACAIAALKADGDVLIEGAEAVNKSYPDFYRHLKLLGAAVSLTP